MKYELAAAGTLRSRDFTGENTINRLRPIDVRKGEISFTFDGYSRPDAAAGYEVKAAVVATSRMKPPIPTAQFGGFGENGFTLTVAREGAPLKPSEIKRLEFMIQVVRL